MRLTLLLLVVLAAPAGAQSRRALLIGIDDYTASTFPKVAGVEHRGWPDLQGAANDVRLLRELLIHSYGFRSEDVVTLTNQQATRAAILGAIDRHLVRPARQGDILFYYFAGHGSQVPNPASDEPDRLDESIVPADSRRGAADIRDKELRPLFGRILDRGAGLTLLLDHCHSGSGFRGLPSGARPRGIRRSRTIVDARRYGPRPEERGALVLASTQDFDLAWETRGDDGQMHGAFTWAWIRALRDAAAGEPAHETFLRAQAWTPLQAPVLLGQPEARQRPFLGVRADRRDRAVVAVERVQRDGSVILQGGWADGLTVDTTLRLPRTSATLRITTILGLGRSIARVEGAPPPALRAGALLEVTGWAAPPLRPLKVWAPVGSRPAAFAQRLAAVSKARWVSDPLATTPTHVLRARGTGWVLLHDDGRATALADERVAVAAVAHLRMTDALFVQLPAPKPAIVEGVVAVADPREADYLLAGRYHRGRVEYAWIRPQVERWPLRPPSSSTRRPKRPPLHLDTTWVESITRLRELLLTLRRIHGWQTLEAPPDPTTPYRLALRREKTNEVVRGRTVFGGETYTVVLRGAPSAPLPRYYYVFAIDSFGKSYLIYPRYGTVENRFPVAAPTEISLGRPSAFGIHPPYGTDTYYLLSTEDPLPNPTVLEWDGVRAPAWTKPLSPLEQLLVASIRGDRGVRLPPTSRWSIERVVFESIKPGGSRRRR